ncbi:MAG: RNA methyltransferase [Clostridia bacterium]|nr:RNA methyltransferase [Clostridia bacterium]
MRIDKDIITSRQNRDVVEAVKLLDRKGREKSRLFRIDGIKLAAEAAEKGVELSRVFVRRSSLERVESELGALLGDLRCTVVEDGTFEKMSEEKSPEGVICIAKYLDNLKNLVKIDSGDPLFADGKRVMLAESLRDPGNLGTVVRSAAALGCERLIAGSDCADPYNPRALRASMGALFRLEVVFVPSVVEAVAALRENGRRVFAAALDASARKLGSFELTRTDCFVVGNEGHGLSPETVRSCTHSVYIPMRAGSESLNAAAAATVLLWEQERTLI